MQRSFLIPILAASLLAACGGGGSSSPSASAVTTVDACSAASQKSWIRAHLDDVYLWYNEIVDVSATSYSTPADYFYALLVRSRDRFSFTESQAVIDQFFQSGAVVGYGATFVNDNGRLRISYTEPNSPATQQNITRGAEITNINGTIVSFPLSDAQIAALYPDASGTTTKFSVKDAGASSTRDITLVSASVTEEPVQAAHIITAGDNKKVGYVLFNDHIATAEDLLINAFTDFQNNHIDDLVLDLRYNGGGYIYIADEVASMIGGTAAQNKTFEKLQYNDKHPEKTSDPNNTFPFFTTNIRNQPLPQLNLSRVFVLTGPNTCSASESIINGLKGLNGAVQVITIGSTTCGKPYGMEQTNNCGQAYFAIQFKGVNELGQGDYVNGFSPTCAASDDLEHSLGDSGERLLAAALGYRTSGSCPAVSYTQSMSARYAPLMAKEVWRAPWRDMRLPR